MESNGNYPVGTANDPNAPWNEERPIGHKEEYPFDVIVTQTIWRKCVVYTSEYNEVLDENGNTVLAISNAHLDATWKSQNPSLQWLLQQLEEYATKEYEFTAKENVTTRARCKYIIDACREWQQDVNTDINIDAERYHNL